MKITFCSFDRRLATVWTNIVPSIFKINSNTKFSLWEANISSRTEQIPLVLIQTNVHYLVHKSQLLVPTPNMKNPVQALPSYYVNIHFNIIIPSTPPHLIQLCQSQHLPFSPLHATRPLISSLIWSAFGETYKIASIFIIRQSSWCFLASLFFLLQFFLYKNLQYLTFWRLTTPIGVVPHR